MEHTDFERQVMAKLLAGDDPVLEALRHQYSNSTVESTEFTGAGFYTKFKVKSGIPAAAGEKTFRIGDVHGDTVDIKEAIGFVLFVKNGYLSMLEGYTLASDIWPNEYENVILQYNGIGKGRDLESLKAKWA